MAKVADVKLLWTRSPSVDIERVELKVTQNGTETITELGPEVEEFLITVAALSSVSFTLDTWDSEGRKATSQTYTFTTGDLEDPLPATNLGHEVVAVRDVEGPVTPEPPVPPA